MTTLNTKEIIHEIQAHLTRRGDLYRNWYVGIAADIEQRLFGDHNVPSRKHWYIWERAADAQSARAVESHFQKLGCDGDSASADEKATYVYAYLKTATTRP